MKPMLPLFFLLLSSEVHATSPFSLQLRTALRKELGPTKTVIFVDAATFRASPSYGGMAKQISATLLKRLQHKCVKLLSPNSIDYALLAFKKKIRYGGMFIALAGQFSSSKLLHCIAQHDKATKTTFKSFPAYRTKGGYLYAPSKGSIVGVTPPFTTNLHPRKGSLGRALLHRFKSQRFVQLRSLRVGTKAKIQSASGHISLYSSLRIKLHLTFYTNSAAETAKKALSFVNMHPSKSNFLNSLVFNRNKQHVTAECAMTPTQLRNLIRKIFSLTP